MSKQIEINDEAFILDKDWARVFPVKVTGKSGKDYNARYIVKLDVTPGEHNELAFNGIAKPCPFSIPEDKQFTSYELYPTAVKAYEQLIRELENDRDECKKRLEEFPWLIKSAKKRLDGAIKTAGSVFKLNQTVWVIEQHYGETARVEEAKIESFDRGDFQDRPYMVRTKRGQNALWCNVESIYTTREAAVNALKAKLKQEYDKKLAEVS